MGVRHFSLVNSSGASYDLTNRDVFLYEPSGLGFQEETSYQRFGEKHKAIRSMLQQGVPSGKIFFSNPDAYEKYYRFALFCQEAPLTMIYRVRDIEYRRKVRVSKLTKTQLEDGQELRCEVEFTALGLFYRSISAYNAGGHGEGKTYPYTYNYRYSDGASQTVRISSDSHMYSPVILTIYGPARNPVWRHYVNNKLVASGRATCEVRNGNRLIIDSSDIPYRIVEVDSGGAVVEDRYSFSDFETERFLFLQYGENRISVSHGGTNDLRIAAEGMIEYAAV